MAEEYKKTIDLDKVLEVKMGSKAKWVPRPLVSWLKRIVHQDELNDYIWESRHLTGVEWLKDCVNYLQMNLHVEGLENLPPKDNGQRYTFVSNHPLGGIDGVALGSIISEHYEGNMRLLVNDFLMYVPGLAPLCIPINKTGRQGRNVSALIDEGFKSENHILLFPAGICSRKRNGEIVDVPWKKTFISKSIESKRDIVPIYFSGQNSDKFYRLANFSDKYIKKVNIAMIFLVDEMYKNRGKKYTVTFGKPIPWQTFDKSKTPVEWAEFVKSKVYELK